MYKYILSLISMLMLIGQPYAASKPTILVSSSPIAKLVQPLLQDVAEVKIVNTRSQCAHHYHLKPSDQLLIKQADIFIYLHQDFEVFAKQLLANFSGKVINLHALTKLQLVPKYAQIKKPNWHIWLDLKQVEQIQKYLAASLKNYLTAQQQIIEQNQRNFAVELQQLKEQKNILANNKLLPIVIVDSSIEHFFNDLPIGYTLLDSQAQPTFSQLAKLNEALKTNSRQCVLITNLSQEKYYQDLGHQTAIVNSENWHNMLKTNNQGSYSYYYLQIIKQIQQNCQLIE